jgi:hypothetical protein
LTNKKAKTHNTIFFWIKILEKKMMIYVYTLCISNFDFNISNTKKTKTQITLAQNFRENNVDFDYICYVFLILFRLFPTRKVAETDIILAQNFRENSAGWK